ncbi:MAG: FAD-binding protein [Clostridia bacterium]|nr:FAD-binding protein [Clostridia bacterium]
MKKLTALMLALLVLVLAAMGFAEGTFTPGTYEATVASVGGPLTVEVEVDENTIQSVTVKEINDTPGIYNVAAERIPATIVESQSVNVDTVSGATLTSVFLKTAINQALKEAATDLSAFQTKVTYEAPAQVDQETDIVIAGAGLSGLSAALTAASGGYSVVLLEELSYVGGNAIPSDQYSVLNSDHWQDVLDTFNAAGTDLKFEDFWGGMMQRMMPATKTDSSVMAEIAAQLRKAAEDKGVIVLTETPVIDLIIEDGAVKGVVAKPLNQDAFRVTAKATLLTTGGFQGNKALIDEYLPYATGAMVIGPSKGAGEAFTWLKDFDIATRDMDYELAMFYSINPANGHHAVWGTINMNFLNDDGQLITDDHDYNSGSMKTYMAVGNKQFYTLWTQKDVDASGEEPEVMEEFLRSGTVTAFDSLSALLEAYPLESLRETLTGLGYTEEDTYYIARARSGIYGTMGGIAVDDDFRVLLQSGETIPGLFAAGETIGRNFGGSNGGATQSGYDAALGIARVLGE